MPWIADYSLTYFQRFCVNVLKAGPVPEHIAVIMDGNRRYATKEHQEKINGHKKGFDKLSETLYWCRELGIKEVTVYAFSIENFKRTPEEVQQLMDLAAEKFTLLLAKERERLKENGVCIRVIGNLDLIPTDLRKLIADSVLYTKYNKAAFLNIAFAYTSRDEITNSINIINKGVINGDIQSNDITEDLISKCMYSYASPEPDMLIRTSGEIRFSDFLLWQIWNSNVVFAKILWPEFSLWHLLAAIFHYQRFYDKMKRIRMERVRLCETETNCESIDRVTKFLNKVKYDRYRQLEAYTAA